MKAELLLSVLVLGLVGDSPPTPQRPLRPPLPGHEGGGTVLLPNGWKIAPAGRHLALGDLPLEMVESPDGRHLIVTNDGYAKPNLNVVDLAQLLVKQRLPVSNAWLGLAWHPDGTRLYASGGGDGTILEFAFKGGRIEPGRTLALPKPESDSFVSGLALSADGSRIFALQVLGDTLNAVDLARGAVVQTVSLPAEPYAALLSRDGRTLFVSLWGGSRVLALDAITLATQVAIPVGEHPNAMALSPDGTRLFVACANTNAVFAIDVAAHEVREEISVALYPQAPPGSTPNGLGVSPDGRALIVANADNNALAFVDISRPGESEVQGFIPVGWYPTAARFSRDGRRIFVLNGKGLTSVPNPRGPENPFYIGQLLQGALSVLPVPDPASLAAFTKKVYALTPYSDSTRLAPRDPPERSPIPRRVGDSSPIKHVFYVIRENRSYDQILGDLGSGNGDPNLCLFGEEITPNAHALAREFVLLDNFYVDAEVSADGHAYSMGAYATDFIKKTWPMNYAHRGGDYLTEGGRENRNPYGNITAPARGYLWDAAKRAGMSVRSYGEFAHRGEIEDHDSGKGEVVANVPGLTGLVAPDYPPWDLSIPDNRRVDAWLKEFHRFEKEGGLPGLSIIRLGDDHTAGTKPGFPTPRAMIAENDLALGRLVEAISASPFWRESAVFIIEDDAQNGPDHVDAHRSPAFLASPYAKRGVVDSTLYTTSGMLRTIELILGLEPLSQYDAAATPWYGSFKEEPDLRPFAHRPPRVSLEEHNDASAYGAAASMAMDLEDADRIPMREMNEILWKSIRGVASPLPPPVRAAFLGPRHRLPAAATPD